MTPDEDLDEFDRIINNIHVLRQTTIVTDRQIRNMSEIRELFKRRVARKEVSPKSYITYLYFAADIGDRKSHKTLVEYAFNGIFDKLTWYSRILALNEASNMKHAQFDDMLQFTFLMLMKDDYNSIMKQLVDINGYVEGVGLTEIIQMIALS